ncbi:MAG: hypothetical protein ACD_12C00099G0003 [uncultured bacterium]|nr:MAG: hypothetical protein ACD_12C00099G0003 [uncultured bacterium]
MKKATEEKIKELLGKGVEEVIIRENLERKLKSGKKLRIKFGIDPTAPILHLGHYVIFRKLKEFQDLGHQVIFLIGDFTGLIGDPSGQSQVRKMLTIKELKENEKNYLKQTSKALNVQKIEVRHNSEWYDKRDLGFIIEIGSKFTYARLAERDDFRKRIEEDKTDISLLELLYPVLQGYDSLALKADVEIGGTDQKFNLLMGRKVQRRYHYPEQDIITVPLLKGLDGVRKMSKSYQNYIAINSSPKEMFGKIMAIPDELLEHYFELLTDVPLAKLKEELKAGANPRDLKAWLARDIVTQFHSKAEVAKAEKEFNKVFQKKEKPSKIPEVILKAGDYNIVELLSKLKLVSSKSEARRLVEQGGVKIDDEVVVDWKKKINVKKRTLIQVGKRKFVKIK